MSDDKKFCEADESIGLFYLFGSMANGSHGPTSDYDFAVYFDPEKKVDITDKKLKLIADLSYVIKSNKVDLVVLNESISPELKYAVIREGKLIFEREPFRVVVEPRIMNEYFDFRIVMLKYGLTQKVYVE